MKNKKHETAEEKDVKQNDTEANEEEFVKGGCEEELENSKIENAKLKETLLRKAAEFENYKKRTEVEISSYIKYASESLIKNLLPVYDDIGRSVQSIEKGETKDFETLKKGVELIYDKFKKVLEAEGLKEINSAGKPFDVDVNSALMQIPRADVEPNTVLEVVEKGYYLKDKVIRHEKVLVSSEPIE
jgi:molecular chaperone GrpE